MSSNLPPGVTNAMIEAHFTGGDCEVCGHPADDCICPECPICGEAGNPDCYSFDAMGNPCGTDGGHNMQRNWDQEIDRQVMRLRQLEDQVQDQLMFIDQLKGERDRWCPICKKEIHPHDLFYYGKCLKCNKEAAQWQMKSK